jgi:hypothetical protein
LSLTSINEALSNRLKALKTGFKPELPQAEISNMNNEGEITIKFS